MRGVLWIGYSACATALYSYCSKPVVDEAICVGGVKCFHTYPLERFLKKSGLDQNSPVDEVVAFMKGSGEYFPRTDQVAVSVKDWAREVAYFVCDTHEDAEKLKHVLQVAYTVLDDAKIEEHICISIVGVDEETSVFGA